MSATRHGHPRKPAPLPRRPGLRLPFRASHRAARRAARPALASLLLALLAACGTLHAPGGSHLPSQRDGPEANPPANLDKVPDAVPQIEPIRIGGPNKPYEVDGRTYTPVTDDRPIVEKGLASWYGRKFHGHRTASGEAYNMYAMTAAHKTLPIPSYARVRNPANGREVIVRVNDRGPFSAGRVIDLSYTAALKLGVLGGVQPVEVERITEEDIRTGAAFRRGPTYAAAPAPSPAPAPVVASLGDLDRAPLVAPAPRAEAARSAPRPASRPRPAPVDGAPAPASASSEAVAAAVQAPAVTGRVLSGTGAIAGAAAVATIDVGQATASGAASAATAALPDVGASAPDTPAGVVLPPAPAASADAGLDAAPAAITPAPALARAEPRDERMRAETTAAAGFWVQIGAFRERNGALDFQHRLVDEQPWLAPLLAVFNDRGLNKLQAGPYPSRDDAKSAAERIRVALQLVPTIVEKR